MTSQATLTPKQAEALENLMRSHSKESIVRSFYTDDPGGDMIHLADLADKVLLDALYVGYRVFELPTERITVTPKTAEAIEAAIDRFDHSLSAISLEKDANEIFVHEYYAEFDKKITLKEFFAAVMNGYDITEGTE